MFCPSGFSLCRTLQLESTRIWNDLQDAETFNSPLHEDSITQTLALNFNRQHGGQNRVHLFSRAKESKNGSDFLWLFFSSDLARHFRVAVQAKRLYPSGKYDAFKKAQACTIYDYAQSISAVSVYVFYNFFPFHLGYYAFNGRRRYAYHDILGFDHGRDLGAIFVPTEDILKLSTPSLSAKDIAGTFLPLWHPFCGCDQPEARSPLDELAERFTRWGAAEDRDVPVCQETNPQLKRWMEGGRIDEGSLEDLFRMNSVLPYEGFTPSFVMGTRITNSERPV